MGTTIKNIHVFVDEQRVEDVHVNTIKCLRLFTEKAGYEIVSAKEADLSIRVVSMLDSPWISVYQTDPLRHLPNLTTELSKTLDGLPVIEFELYDSDVFQMQLSQNGMIVDVFNDWENYDEYPRRKIGNAQIWESIFSAVTSTQALETAWLHQSADSPFESEGAMYRIMDLLNIDEWRVWIEKTLDSVPATATVSELHFRYSRSLPYDDKATGLPMLQITSYPGKAGATLERNHDVFFSVMNRGGYGKGVEIELHGAALDSELVEPIGLITQPPFNSFTGEIVASPEVQNNKDSTKIFRFNLNNHPIPAGIADWDAVYELPHHQRDFTREFEFGRKGGSFAIVFKPLKIGKGELLIRVIPKSNPEAYGEFITDFDVTT